MQGFFGYHFKQIQSMTVLIKTWKKTTVKIFI